LGGRDGVRDGGKRRFTYEVIENRRGMGRRGAKNCRNGCPRVGIALSGVMFWVVRVGWETVGRGVSGAK